MPRNGLYQTRLLFELSSSARNALCLLVAKESIVLSIRSIRYEQKKHKHTTGGIPRWSPTLVLVARFSAYVWQSGRDAQFSLTYGRMYYSLLLILSYNDQKPRA
jgi:hypothetical protein